MSAEEIDQYLDALEEPKRTTLARLRQTILDILPEAERGISCGVPAFKVAGRTIAGFAAFKNHLSYLPHSGSVFPQLRDELTGYSTTSGALRFRIDQPLPVSLVEKLIAVRLQQAFPARGTAGKSSSPAERLVRSRSMAVAGRTCERRRLHTTRLLTGTRTSPPASGGRAQRRCRCPSIFD